MLDRIRLLRLTVVTVKIILYLCRGPQHLFRIFTKLVSQLGLRCFACDVIVRVRFFQLLLAR